MLKHRLVTVIIGAPLLLFAIYSGSWILMFGIIGLYLLGIYEFINIAKKAGFEVLEKAMYIAGIILIAEIYFWQGKMFSFALLFVFLLLILQWLVQKKAFSLSNLGISIFGIMYISLLKYILLLRMLPEGFLLIILVFTLTWMVDTGAYFIGCNFGKNKLAPNISPNKTIEGAIGGFFTTIVIALIFNFTIFSMGLTNALLLGAIIAIIGQMGDLFESLLKRKAELKDSGNILPGHGGILDRFDSIIFTVPVAYYFIVYFIM